MPRQNQNRGQSQMSSGQKSNIDILFPSKGIDESTSHSTQSPGTTFGSLNVMTYDAEEGRGRGGRRPGLVKKSLTNLGGSIRLIDTINVVSTAIGGLFGSVVKYIGKFSNRKASIQDMMSDADPTDSEIIPVPDQEPLASNVLPDVVEMLVQL